MHVPLPTKGLDIFFAEAHDRPADPQNTKDRSMHAMYYCEEEKNLHMTH
jgi:hypothetical protein